jgi:hypothetical protein
MKCYDCKTRLDLSIMKLEAGYYIGYSCSQCGPYSKESWTYYKTESEAQDALDRLLHYKRIEKTISEE